jgi:hypothetical protein
MSAARAHLALPHGLTGAMQGRRLVFPEVLKQIWRQGGVANRRRNRAVTEIGLNGASVVAVVCEFEPACVTQHVRVDEKGELPSHACLATIR